MKPLQAFGPKPTPGGIVACGAFNGTSAQGIVTRMGRSAQQFGGEAIEPGPAGMRPALHGRFDQQNALRSFAFDPQALVTRCEVKSAGDGARRACAARDGGRAAPLGNTGTTTLEAAP